MTSFLPAARAVALCSCLSILASCDSGSDGTPLVTPQVVRLEIDAEHLFFAQAVLTLVPIDALHGDATLSAVGVSLPATYVVQGSKLTFWFGGPRTARLPTSLLGPERCPLTLQFVTLELDAKIEHGTIASVTGRGTGNAAFWLGHPSATDYEYGLTVVGTRDDAGPTSVIAQTDFVHPLAFDGVQIDAPIAPASLDFALQGVTAPVETLTKTIASLSTTELPVMDYPSVSPMPLEWGAAYEIRAPADGPTDVLGRALTPTGFRVADEPSPFDSPGFEGLAPTATFFLNLVSNGPPTRFLRALEGEKALGLGSGQSATVVFAGPAASELVLRLRYEQNPQFVSLGLDFFEPGVPVAHGQAIAPFGFTGTGDAIAEIRVPLPALATDGSFALQIRNPAPSQCSGASSPSSSVVIEELRLE